MADLRGTHKKFRQYYADTFKSVNTSFTTTGLATAWTPASGLKFVLMGWSLAINVKTVLAAGDEVQLCFVDNALATAVGPALAGFAANAPIGTCFLAQFQMQAGGWESATADNVLKIAATADVSTGVINITGMVWGREIK